MCFSGSPALAPAVGQNEHFTYSRDALLALRCLGGPIPSDLPDELTRKPTDSSARQRKRGRRGGVRQRLRRRGNRPPLPSIILSNVRSLPSKMDELRLMTRYCHEYRESNVMVLTETWLRPDIPDNLLHLEGFSCVRADRSATSGKLRGGGICVYIRKDWCNQVTIRETLCCPDVELLCLSVRPFYLPREFSNIILCAAYVPPGGNAAKAATSLAECVHKQMQRTPEAPVFITGDFNLCRLEQALHGFEQYVKCGTRKDKVLDKCYGNVKSAYRA